MTTKERRINIQPYDNTRRSVVENVVNHPEIVEDPTYTRLATEAALSAYALMLVMVKVPADTIPDAIAKINHTIAQDRSSIVRVSQTSQEFFATLSEHPES